MLKRINWMPGVALSPDARAVALGAFNGIHLGHRAVIAAISGAIDETAPGKPLLTGTVFSVTGLAKSGQPLLTRTRQEQQLFALGVDEWIEAPFVSLRELSPEAFVEQVLHESLHARTVSCGADFRFGKDGEGDAACLTRLCARYGITVRVIAPVERDGEPVSTTRLHAALADGDMTAVMRLLGRPYTVDLPITHGDGRGTAWGIPTLNQVWPADVEQPRRGVYASLVTLGEKQYKAVTNLGVHPTVGEASSVLAETWVDGFEGDVYGQTVAVELIRFLREERTFASTEELKFQIDIDRGAAHELLSGAQGGRAILFDFDDTLQHRPSAFRGVAREMLDRHCPSMTDREKAACTEEMLEENHGGYVDYPTYFADFYSRWPWEGVSSGDELMAEYQRRFAWHDSLFPDAVEVLRELSRRGYRLGLITNGPTLQQNRKADMAGIRALMDVVIISGDEGVKKPNAEIFRRAAARLCVAPERCAYVGDHPEKDVAGSCAAGMLPIYYNSLGTDVHPEGVAEITSLRDLLTRF